MLENPNNELTIKKIDKLLAEIQTNINLLRAAQSELSTNLYKSDIYMQNALKLIEKLETVKEELK